MKNSSDTIGNRTCDFPVCSAVPQPTVPPRAPLLQVLVVISILSQVNPIHILPPHFSTVQPSKVHTSSLLVLPSKFVQFLPQKYAFEFIYSLSIADDMLREMDPSCSDYLNP